MFAEKLKGKMARVRVAGQVAPSLGPLPGQRGSVAVSILRQGQIGRSENGTCFAIATGSEGTVDEAGLPLVAAHARKGEVRYRYYVSKAFQTGMAGTHEGVRGQGSSRS